ncbi:MAG: GNAT family N-acetyltransferase [Alteromonadaceae bacterium]|nr:GNAT family N-acetyltransferase [Alteromonadaceae bacterium]
MKSLLFIETERLKLRPLSDSDAPFMYHLMNDPSWLQFIGDRGIRSVDDAKEYIQFGPMIMYRDRGVGILAAEDKITGETVGTCGLLYRDGRDTPDLGFAFLAQFRRLGYAKESSEALLSGAKAQLGLSQVDALVSPGNDASTALLNKLGFRFLQPLPDFDPDKDTHCYRLILKDLHE